MHNVGLRTTSYAEILYERYTRELHRTYFHAPAPSPLSANAGQLFDCRARPNSFPVDIGKMCTDHPCTGVAEGVVKLGYAKQGLLHAGDLPRHDRVEADTLPISGGRRKTDKIHSPRRDVLVQDDIYVEWDYPVKARSQLSLVNAKPAEQPPLERIQDDKGNEGLEARLDDLEDFIKHESPHYPFG